MPATGLTIEESWQQELERLRPLPANGQILREYARHTVERILIDPSCYEGVTTDRVTPPRPLGKLGRKLQEIYELSVEQRPMDLYAALAEAAR